MEIIVNDDSYAAFITEPEVSVKQCEAYYKCKAIRVPFTATKDFGSGWMFKKRSPFLKLFQETSKLLHERGVIKRIYSSYDARQSLPEQECPNYDGKAVGWKKSFTQFGILMFGAVLSMILFL